MSRHHRCRQGAAQGGHCARRTLLTTRLGRGVFERLRRGCSEQPVYSNKVYQEACLGRDNCASGEILDVLVPPLRDEVADLKLLCTLMKG